MALRKRYREILRMCYRLLLGFERELQKVKHFMPSSLLRSQLDLLHNDELEDAMVKSGSSYRRNYTSIDKIDYSI